MAAGRLDRFQVFVRQLELIVRVDLLPCGDRRQSIRRAFGFGEKRLQRAVAGEAKTIRVIVESGLTMR